MTDPVVPTNESGETEPQPLTPEERLRGQIPPWMPWDEQNEDAAVKTFDDVIAASEKSPLKEAAIVGFGNYVWVNHRDWETAIRRANEELGHFGDEYSRRWA